MFLYDVFLICPVREADEVQKLRLKAYIAKLKSLGLKVYYPADDTVQDDPIGFRICTDNANAISNSEEVHIFFDPKSQGTLFDLGVAFALHKKLVIVNPEELIPTERKSFTNMIIEWSKH